MHSQCFEMLLLQLAFLLLPSSTGPPTVGLARSPHLHSRRPSLQREARAPLAMPTPTIQKPPVLALSQKKPSHGLRQVDAHRPATQKGRKAACRQLGKHKGRLVPPHPLSLGCNLLGKRRAQSITQRMLLGLISPLGRFRTARPSSAQNP